MGDPLPDGCTGRSCDYAVSGTRDKIGTKEATDSSFVGCMSGGGTCGTAYMLSAEQTEFHDAELAAASEEINRILAPLHAKAGGRQLSMLTTDEGMFLAWTHHDRPPAPDAVRHKDGHARVAQALRLKTRSAAS